MRYRQIMRKRVVIRTPFPTAEDFAETYGISKTRMRKLTALAEQIIGNGSAKSRQAPSIQMKRKRKASAQA
jgi:hypothetical protein